MMHWTGGSFTQMRKKISRMIPDSPNPTINIGSTTRVVGPKPEETQEYISPQREENSTEEQTKNP